MFAHAVVLARVVALVWTRFCTPRRCTCPRRCVCPRRCAHRLAAWGLPRGSWDVFEAIPGLWQPAIAEIPGSIVNGTIDLGRKLYARLGQTGDTIEEMLQNRQKGLCKACT